MRENPIEREPSGAKISLKPEDVVGKFHVDEERKKNAIRERAKATLIEGLSYGNIQYNEVDPLESVDNVRGEELDDDYDYPPNDSAYGERKELLSQIPDDVKSSPEVQRAAKEGMLKCLSMRRVEDAIEIRDTFSISTEYMFQPEIISVVLEEIAYRASFDSEDEVIAFINKLLLPAHAVENPSAKAEMIYKYLLARLISTGFAVKALAFRNKLSLSPEVMLSEEVQDAIKTRISCSLSSSDIEPAIYLKTHFLLNADVLTSPEVQNATEKLVAEILSSNTYGVIESAIEMRDTFSLSEAHMAQAVKDGFVARLRSGDIYIANKITQRFAVLPEIAQSEEVQRAAEAGILNSLHKEEEGANDFATNAVDIKTQFTVSPTFLNSPEVQRAVQHIMTNRLSGDYINIDAVVKFKNEFLLSDSASQKAAGDGVIRQIENGCLDNVIKIRDAFSIPKSALCKAIERWMTKSTKEDMMQWGPSLANYLRAHTNFVWQLLQTGKDDLAYKIGSVGVVIDDGTLAQYPEHIASAYHIGYSKDPAKYKSATAIRKEKSPVTIRSILRSLEGKIGKNFRASIEYLFDTADEEAKEMICEIIRSDHASAPRIVRTLVQIDASKGTKYAIDLIRRSSAPDKLFAYFVRLLAKSGGITKNAPGFLRTAENISVIRRIVAEAPNQLDTTLDTCRSLGIENLASEGETLFEALRDLSSPTPKIYKAYRDRTGRERKEFADWVNKQKEELFQNKKIDFNAGSSTQTPGGFAKDRDILIEMIHQAYNPVGMSFTSVKELLTQVGDRTGDLADYTFPERGYSVRFSDTSYQLRRGEALNAKGLEQITHLMRPLNAEALSAEQKEAFHKMQDIAFTKLAKSQTNFSDEETGIFLQAMTTHEPVKRLLQDIDNKKGTYDYSLLVRMYEILGIYAKDNFPLFLSKYTESRPELDTLIKNLPKSRVRRSELLKQLKANANDPQVANVPDTALMGRLFAERVLETRRSILKKEMRKFERAAGSEGEMSGEYRVYLSKNQGSFFAKAAAGICTAGDIPLWNMRNHFHLNVTDERSTVQGNVQGYFETVNGKPALVLRGFNPTETMLKQVAPESYVNNMIRIAKEFAAANKIENVYITEDGGGWHADSNRPQIRECIKKNIYAKIAPVPHTMTISSKKTVSNIYPL